LLKAIDLLEWYFDEIDRPLPEVSISLPWPEGSDRETLAGQCFSKALEKDGVITKVFYTKIFIAPDVVEDLQVLETLVHELAHAAIGCHVNHDVEPFPTVFKQLGLEGPLDKSRASLPLRLRLLNVSNTLGPYPEF